MADQELRPWYDEETAPEGEGAPLFSLPFTLRAMGQGSTDPYGTNVGGDINLQFPFLNGMISSGVSGNMYKNDYDTGGALTGGNLQYDTEDYSLGGQYFNNGEYPGQGFMGRGTIRYADGGDVVDPLEADPRLAAWKRQLEQGANPPKIDSESIDNYLRNSPIFGYHNPVREVKNFFGPAFDTESERPMRYRVLDTINAGLNLPVRAVTRGDYSTVDVLQGLTGRDYPAVRESEARFYENNPELLKAAQGIGEVLPLGLEGFTYAPTMRFSQLPEVVAAKNATKDAVRRFIEDQSGSVPARDYSSYDQPELPSVSQLSKTSGQSQENNVFPIIGQPKGKVQPLERTLSSEGFYYAADEALKNAQRKKGNPQAWINEFKKAGVPSSEMQWRKINEYLASKPANEEITKEDLFNHLNNNKLRTDREVHDQDGITPEHALEMEREYIWEQARQGEFRDQLEARLDAEKVNDVYKQHSVEYDPKKQRYNVFNNETNEVVDWFRTEEEAKEGLQNIAENIVKETDEYPYAVYQDGELINRDYSSKEAALDAGNEYLAEHYVRALEDKDPIELIRERGDIPAEGTYHYLSDTIPKGTQESYGEHVLNLNSDDLKRMTGSSREFVKKGAPHPSEYYPHSVGWTLEQDFENALGGGNVRVIHEVQSPEGQVLSGQSKPLSQDQIAKYRKDAAEAQKEYMDNVHNIIRTSDKYYDLSSIRDAQHRQTISKLLQDIDDFDRQMKSYDDTIERINKDQFAYSSPEAKENDLERATLGAASHERKLNAQKNRLKEHLQAYGLENDVRELNGGPEIHDLYNQNINKVYQLELKAKDANTRLKQEENRIPTSPIVETNSGLEALLKNALYRAAKDKNDFVALSGPKRMLDRWRDEGVSKLYEKKVPDILLKLARQHDPKVQPEMVYPADRNFYNNPIKYFTDRLPSEEIPYSKYMQPETQPDLPFNSDKFNNTFASPHINKLPEQYKIRNPISHVGTDFLDEKYDAPRPFANQFDRATKALQENRRPVYTVRNAYDQVEGGNLYFSTKERAEEAMKIINQQLDDRYKQKPEELIEKWENENSNKSDEPYFGIRLTPKMKESILKNGFSLFALLPLLYNPNAQQSTEDLPRLRPLN